MLKVASIGKIWKREKYFTKEVFIMNTYIVFDLETTGFSSDAEIIEIAALKITDGIVSDTFQTLVKPSTFIPSFVQKLTSITNEMVQDSPSISEVLPLFLNFAEDFSLIGHNISTFDLPFLNRVLSKTLNLKIQNDYVDTLPLTKQKLDLDNYKLSTIAEHFNIDTQNAHRALKDCYITYECFEKLQHLPDKEVEHNTHSVLPKHNKSISKKTAAARDLIKILQKIIDYEELTPYFAEQLRLWVTTYNELADQYPFEQANYIIASILSSDVFDCNELISFFNMLNDPVTMCSDNCTDFCISGKTFCLTGEFDYGEKSMVINSLTEQGGILQKNVVKSLDYLIVGNKGSDSWSFDHYGGKVKKAMEYNEKGCHIQVVQEHDISI